MDSFLAPVRLCAAVAFSMLLALLVAGPASAGIPDFVANVKDIKSGGAGSDSISPLSALKFVAIGDSIYFVADDGTHGKELWRSDGTPDGTEMVEDINPNGSDGSNPDSLTNVGGTLFLSANDGTDGQELWTSDGTAAGTDMVKDIWTGAGASSFPAAITAIGGVAYFAATDSPGSRTLWRSDGSEDGTDPVLTSGAPASPTELTAIGGTIYFAANSGDDLWKTDGTPGGTQLVKDLNDGSSGSGVGQLTQAGTTIFFIFGISGTDRVLWTTDGTTGGTVPVPGQVANFNPTGLEPLGNSILFEGNGGGANRELWRSDGSGVELVKDVIPGQMAPTDLTNIGGIVYFSGNDSGGQEPWRSDGTEAGTFQLKDINPGPGSSYPGRFTDFNGKVMFAAGDTLSNFELWRSDGTGTGTSQLGNINPTGSSSPNYLTKLGGKLLFGADDGSHGFELWVATDTIAPQTTIDSGPGEGQTVAGSPTIGFSSDDNPATFQCSIDGGAFAACSPPNTLPALADGAHSFAVRAIDSGANVDPTPAQRNFTVKAEVAGPQGPQGPTTASLDTQAPNASLSGAAAQKLGKTLAVTVSCADEACTATAGGTVNKSKLGTATKSIAKGGNAKLQLKIAKKLAKSIKKALRARKKVTANVQVTVADVAGNTRVVNKKIRIKR